MLERANLQRALKQVHQNKGAPGIDGMSVDDLPEYLRHHWPEIRVQLETGRYRPQPVKRVDLRGQSHLKSLPSFSLCTTALEAADDAQTFAAHFIGYNRLHA